MKKSLKILITGCFCFLLAACQSRSEGSGKNILATEGFLADITQNVTGDRMKVDSLIPSGVDPHAFEATPKDVARVADSSVVVINGGGLESWLQGILNNAGGQRLVIEASKGLTPRNIKAGEMDGETPGGIDPHFWLNPLNVVKYAENIRDGLSQVDPDGTQTYAKNAETYAAKLKELDGWIAQQVATIPSERRLLITNHEEFGYFADRYGFKVIGTIIPSFTSEASPSAKELAQLSEEIRATGATTIFLETGSNPQLAEQIANETGIKVVTDLYTHSITAPSGPAPTYIDMMRYNVGKIVGALKGK